MTGEVVLVIEDNALNLKLVRDVLQYAGYDVVEAHSGEEGVQLAVERAPDLVLMDLQLPGIDGAEALRQIRAREQAKVVPVIAVTAFAMKNDQELASLAGFDGYLAKPINVRAFPSQIRAFLADGVLHGP
jgi:two-component system cell cycle response regulator DivK